MNNVKKVLGIIPARSGSKGLKDKNIRPLNGKPLCLYTIEAAIKSEIFDDIYFNTDSEEYVKVVEDYQVRTKPLRSEALASDQSSTYDVLKEVLANEDDGTLVVLLQVTSPCRNAKHIKEAYELARTNNCPVVSVSEVDVIPELMCPLGANKEIDKLTHFNANSYRRQDSHYYKPNGAIYIFSVGQFKHEQTIFPKGLRAYVMSKHSSIDVDDIIDFKLAELIEREQL